MPNNRDVVITPEILNNIAEIDAFNGAWAGGAVKLSADDLQPDEEKRTVLDIEHDYKTAKNNFAQLIKDTLYTDNSIKAPKNVDLAKYDLKEPKKLSDNQLIYGKLFIEAADLYRCLRMYWLAIVKESPSVAELLEILLADAVKFGYSHCRLKYIEQEVKMITG